eukprot:CAMPEP_0114981094 /NCGR_PEP_ID=MMETSP0216-20121206/5345_1 /TAXON_ID=223996 /ORGANISM="Protocruzia adherens, Strain Boccale" /LENGTH=131 /DNA_ID=CAMNT_0002342711 /DNA_START=395 /DNA_END=790 /DNA_ORIENTATION=+
MCDPQDQELQTSAGDVQCLPSSTDLGLPVSSSNATTNWADIDPLQGMEVNSSPIWGNQFCANKIKKSISKTKSPILTSSASMPRISRSDCDCVDNTMFSVMKRRVTVINNREKMKKKTTKLCNDIEKLTLS